MALEPELDNFAMTDRPTALERAFQLARWGDCATVTDVRTQLVKEGHSASQLEGPTLLRQLKDIVTAHYRVPEAEAEGNEANCASLALVRREPLERWVAS